MGKSLLLVLALLLGVAGCNRNDSPGATAQAQAEDMVPLQTSILNYSDETAENVTVDGSWAGGMGPHAGGGKFAGSTAVPRQWRSDFQLTIRWQDKEQYADPVWRSGGPMRFHERRLSVQPYQQDEKGRIGMLWVAFFPDDQIKLYPTAVDPGHPDFPEGLDLPTIQCRKDFPGNPKCDARSTRKDEALGITP